MEQQHGGSTFIVTPTIPTIEPLPHYRKRHLQLLTITYNYLQLLTISCNDTIKLYTTCIYLLTQNDITGRRSTYVQ